MSTAPAPSAISSKDFVDALIADIDRTHNYRKTYDKAKLEQLAESIDANGVIEPVVIRPGTNGKPWALVVGERRVRASIIAKRTTIPAIIRRDLDDASARAVSIVENLQREDVDALEEADGFKELYDPPMSWPVDKIAAQVGQKRSYVYGRLKLCSLCEAGRDDYRKGELDLSVAILIARIASKETQVKAVQEFRQWGGRIPYEQAARLVHERYMLRLAGAHFDTADEKLLPAAGSCAKCPKRTGNQRELFADVKSADVCTDPPCFKKKSDAAWLVTAAAAEKKGNKVIGDAEAAKLFPHGQHLAHAAPFIDLAEECWGDKKDRPYKKLVAKGTPVVLARDPSGVVHELVPKAELAAAMKGSGVKLEARTTSATRTAGGASEAKQRKAAERKRAVVKAAIAEIVAKAKPTVGFFRAILGMMIAGGYHNALADLCKRRGWVEKGKQWKTIVEGKAKAMGDAELPGLVLELAMSRDAYWAYAVGVPRSVQAAAAAMGINVKAIEKRVSDEAKAKEKAKTSKKKGGRK